MHSARRSGPDAAYRTYSKFCSKECGGSMHERIVPYEQMDDLPQAMNAHQLHEVCRKLMELAADDELKALARELQEYQERHYPGCVCADCSGAELKAEND